MFSLGSTTSWWRVRPSAGGVVNGVWYAGIGAAFILGLLFVVVYARRGRDSAARHRTAGAAVTDELLGDTRRIAETEATALRQAAQAEAEGLRRAAETE